LGLRKKPANLRIFRIEGVESPFSRHSV
jgi:hypothetical protein